MRLTKLALLAIVALSACGELGESPGWELDECVKCTEEQNAQGQWETVCRDTCY